MRRRCECSEDCCWVGQQIATFQDSALDSAVNRFNGYGIWPVLPFEMARLLVEIREDAAPGLYRLNAARVSALDVNGTPTYFESDAYDASSPSPV